MPPQNRSRRRASDNAKRSTATLALAKWIDMRYLGFCALKAGLFLPIMAAMPMSVGLANQNDASPAAVSFCLIDGTKLNAERFEQKDGRFLFYVPGSSAPLEYPASSIRGINVTDCSAIAQAAPQQTSDFGIHGSNTIGERLMPLLIEAYGRQRFNTQPVFKPTKFEEQDIRIREGATVKAVIDFQSHGSGTAAKGLLDGTAIIGMSSRPMKPEEAKPIATKYQIDPRTPGSETVLALDGLAVIVHPSNPVKDLSLDQISRIFAGELTSWADVGGLPKPIKAHRRDNKSGTFDTFKGLVLDPSKRSISERVEAHESSENVSASVNNDTDAIGFIGLPYVNLNRAVGISSACGLTGLPTHYSVKSESYPLSRRLYLYSVGIPSHPVARDLRAFSLSDDAQPTIKDAGFVDQSIEMMDPGDQQSWVNALVAKPSWYPRPN